MGENLEVDGVFGGLQKLTPIRGRKLSPKELIDLVFHPVYRS